MRNIFKPVTMRVALQTILFIIGVCSAIAQQPTAKVYFLRFDFSLLEINRPEISVNDLLIGNLPNKKYIECIVPVGNLNLSMYFSGTGDNRCNLNLQTAAGQVYYIKASVKIQGTAASPTVTVNLNRLTDKEGAKLLKKCKESLVADVTEYVKPDTPEDAQQYIEVAQAKHQLPAQMEGKKRNSDVDLDIPNCGKENKNTFALIIANEDYMFVDNVPYALNDGNAFKEYCIKTLGIPERQIWFYENASLGIISNGINKMVQAMNIFDGANAIVYYCGHGIPDEKTAEAYIVPVDGNGSDTSSCYSLNKLYNTLANAKAANITYFMDACFTGANRDGSMLVAARGVAREPKKEVIKGRTIVFSAASGDETAMPYKEKEHGLFTYFLLKKLQETKGDVTYGDLAKYINENVKREAFLTNEKPQNPVVATSNELSSSWQRIKLK